MPLLYNQEADFRQERNLGQKFSAAFEFIGVHWRGLGRALLILAVPAMLLNSVLSAIIRLKLQEAMFSGEAPSATDYGTGFYSRMLTLSKVMNSPLYWANAILGTLTVGIVILTIYSYLVLNMRRTSPGAPITVAEVWTEIKSHLLFTTLSIWVLTIIIVVGMVVLLLPGIYLAVGLSLFFIVRVVEKTNFMSTFSRSLYLTRGKWWSTFGLIAIMILMVYVLFAFLSLFAVLFSKGFFAMFQWGFNQSPLVAVAFAAIVNLLSLLFYPPMLLVLAFQYFNLIERKEGTGLYLLVNKLGQQPGEVSNETYRPNDEGEY